MEPKWWCNQTPTAYSMTLPCPHLDQLERSEDHVNSWHRPRRQQWLREFPRIWTEAQALRDGRYLRHSRKTAHRRTHVWSTNLQDYLRTPQKRTTRTFGVPFSRITIAAASWRYRTWNRQPTRDAEDHRTRSRRPEEGVWTGVAIVCPEPHRRAGAHHPSPTLL